MLLTDSLAQAIGVDEPAIRLILTLVLGYPLARYYHVRYERSSDKITTAERSRCVLLSGLGLSLFFNGLDVIHSLITVTASYAISYAGVHFKQRQQAAMAIWILNGLYLLLGYHFMNADDYDISWTMTQCVLCLRLMGFSLDLLDGEKVQTKQSSADAKPKDQALPLSFGEDTPLVTLPAFEYVLAYCFFPSAFLVGPQFSFSLYWRWLTRTWDEEEDQARNKDQQNYVWRCVALGAIYLLLQQLVGSRYPTAYLITDDFARLDLPRRFLTFWITGKFAFCQYLGIWLLAEGATAQYGLSYDDRGKDTHGTLFGGLANTLPMAFESASSIDHVIASFNVNTNFWSKYYIFKRLKHLGNKRLSQAITLAFLAIWHGFHPIYFFTFLIEYLDIECERVIRKRVLPHVQMAAKRNAAVHYAWKITSWATCSVAIAYAMVGFNLLLLNKAYAAYKHVGFFGHTVVLIVLGADRLLPAPKTRID